MKSRLIKVFNTLVLCFVQGCSPCTKFVRYDNKSLNVDGIKFQLGSKIDVGVASIHIDPQIRAASDKLQTLDLTQFALCEEIPKIRDEKIRTQKRIEYIDALNQMLRQQISSDSPDSGKSKSSETKKSFPPPVLLCLESRSDPENFVDFSLTSSCEGCDGAKERLTVWSGAGSKVSTTYNGPANLKPAAAAELNISCDKTEDNFGKINLIGKFSVLAGWGGKPDEESPYRPARAEIKGQFRTGFRLLGDSAIVEFVNLRRKGNQVKGYPGSKFFPNDYKSNWPPYFISFKSPSGKILETENGIYVVREKGTYTIQVKLNIEYTSGWAEDSGTMDFENNLEIGLKG